MSVSDSKCNNKIIGKTCKGNFFQDDIKGSNIRIIDKNLKITEKFFKVKWLIPPQAREVQYKIINGYYLEADMLRKRFGFEVDACCFRLQESETIDHLVYSCPVMQRFCQNPYIWLDSGLENITPCDAHQILIFKDGLPKEFSNMINVVMIMGKNHIHSCKWKNQKPSINWFKSVLGKYCSSLQIIANSNQKTESFCQKISQFLRG